MLYHHFMETIAMCDQALAFIILLRAFGLFYSFRFFMDGWLVVG